MHSDPTLALSSDFGQLPQFRPAGVGIAPCINAVDRKLSSRLAARLDVVSYVVDRVGRRAARIRGSVGTRAGPSPEGNEKERRVPALFSACVIVKRLPEVTPETQPHERERQDRSPIAQGLVERPSTADEVRSEEHTSE